MRQEPLVIEESAAPENGIRTLRLKGPIVISNLFDFQTRVRSSKARALILDMTDIPYVDSAGVGVLVGAYVTHQKEGRSLALVGDCDRVRGTLSVTQMESFFRFFDSGAAAQQAAESG